MDKQGLLAPVLKNLKEISSNFLHLVVSQEPTVDLVDEICAKAREINCGLVVAMGGGSVLDTAKAVAALYHQEHRAYHFMEGIGDKSLQGKLLPWMALPTTAGTGSEATTNAVLGGIHPALGTPFKKSLRHPHLPARVALLDPELSLFCPPLLSASCGLDALTQLLESLVSTQSNELTLAWCKYGLELSLHNLSATVLAKANTRQQALQQRSALALAAFISGMALSTSGLGTVHGLAGPLGALSQVPHGIACGLLLGPCLAHNMVALQKPDSNILNPRALELYCFAGNLLQVPAKSNGADHLVNTVKNWRMQFSLPGLSTFGITGEVIEAVVAQGQDRKNPVQLGPQVWKSILEECT